MTTTKKIFLTALLSMACVFTMAAEKTAPEFGWHDNFKIPRRKVFSKVSFEDATFNVHDTYKSKILGEDSLKVLAGEALLDVELNKGFSLYSYSFTTNRTPMVLGVVKNSDSLENVPTNNLIAVVEVFSNDSCWHTLLLPAMISVKPPHEATIKLPRRRAFTNNMLFGEFNPSSVRAIKKFQVFRFCITVDGKKISNIVYSISALNMFDSFLQSEVEDVLNEFE